MNIGDKIKKIRNQRDYTLHKLSVKTGIPPSFLSDIENNRSTPPIKSLKDIANALSE
ncbi:MAG: helix-turn-helix domain-containing protein [archaeon]